MIRPRFRIPISPTRGFFAQVKFFECALRRLNGVYDEATLDVVVGGGDCRADSIVRENKWSVNKKVNWIIVPRGIFHHYGMHGTANWRFFPEMECDEVLILSDADTALLGDVDPLLADFPLHQPCIAGHMAHLPPPVAPHIRFPKATDFEFWPQLFSEFGAVFPEHLHRYSMDVHNQFPLAPPYFNLGFVAMNKRAVDIFRQQIFEFESVFNRLINSNMRCQIACTVIAHQYSMDVKVLPASYNAANDATHYHHNGLAPADVRVIHYLRDDEIDRSTIFLPENVGEFLRAALRNPINVELQKLTKVLYTCLLEG